MHSLPPQLKHPPGAPGPFFQVGSPNMPPYNMPFPVPHHITEPVTHVVSPPALKKKEPPQPRSKVRPCDHCRRRKTKCTLKSGTTLCLQCESRGLKCTYSDNLVKRNNGSEDEFLAKRSKLDPALQPPPDIPIREANPVTEYAQIQGESLLKKTLSLQYPRSSYYVGTTSVYDPLLLSKFPLDKIDQLQMNPRVSMRKVSDNTHFLLRDDYSDALYNQAVRDADSVEKFVAPHGQVLINLYFRIVHPSFPILHKRVFLEKYSRTHREFSAPLLAAVYLLAIKWWDYDPQLCQHPKPNVAALSALAYFTFQNVLERPKLSAVQAGLLLLQFHHSSPRNWTMCSQVVALAEELGLGIDCSNWKLPKWERGLRTRLAWAVYLQDKWSSLIEARPTHIFLGKNWIVRDLVDEDFPESSLELENAQEGSMDVDIGRGLFKNMISLSFILGEILVQFYQLENVEESDMNVILQRAKPLQLSLRNWYHNLPQDLTMNSLQPRKLNSNGYLQLAYFAAELTLHRKIISALYKAPDPPQQLVEVCRSAAKTRLQVAVEFVRDLKPEHVHSFWHSSATSNFTMIGVFAAILYITSSNAEESAWLKDQILNYRWILRVGSKGFDEITDALEKLESILFHIPGLLQQPMPTSPADSVSPHGMWSTSKASPLSQQVNVNDEKDSNEE